MVTNPAATSAPGAVDSLSARHSRAVRRRLLTPVVVLFAVLAAVFATGIVVPVWLQYVPFAASVLVLGLPHGAADHLVPAWLDRRRQEWTSIARVIAVYLVLAAVTFALWIVAPVAAALGFVLLTWFHWGQGDLYIALAVDDSTYLDTRGARVAAVLVRGGLPMTIPVLAHPGTLDLFLASTAGLVDASALPAGVVDTGPLRAVAVTAFLAVVGAVAVVTRSRCRTAVERRTWARDQLEVAVLLGFFATVPPVLALGLYFSLWHALRHFVRLDRIDVIERDRPRSVRERVVTLTRACAPTTAVAIAALVVVALVVPGAQQSGASALGAYLVLISALTVPHVAVVTFMDRRQRIWRPEPLAVSQG